MKLKNKIATVLILVVGISTTSYFYLSVGKRDLSTEESCFKINANAISTEFVSDLELSNKKYLEKPIEISGTITQLNDSVVTLDKIVLCYFNELHSTLKINSQTTIKGRVVGYDDLMGELKLDKCFIIK